MFYSHYWPETSSVAKKSWKMIDGERIVVYIQKSDKFDLQVLRNLKIGRRNAEGRHELKKKSLNVSPCEKALLRASQNHRGAI